MASQHNGVGMEVQRMNHSTLQKDTAAWIFQVWASFVISIIVTGVGICYLPVDVWIKAFMAMGMFFTVGSSFTLSKTIRDNHEAGRFINRIAEAKTEKMLTEFEFK